MSYYYNYYLGYKDANGKISPLGPYDMNGKIHSVISRSRSFASSLHNRFHQIQEKQISKKLRKEFEYEGWNGEKQFDVKYLSLKDLPAGSFIKRGYFLADKVEAYERYCQENGEPIDSEDFFYEYLSPTVYAEKLRSEMAIGVPSPKYDEEGGELEQYSCADYIFYAYPDYTSEEHEAEMLRAAASCFEYAVPELNKDGVEIVVLETEG